MNRMLARLLHEDQGSISAITAAGLGIVVVLFAFVTTVHGNNDVHTRAAAIAAEAGRAAETAVNTRGTVISVDPVDAQTAARAYLAAAGATGTVTIISPTRVRVTVVVDRPAVLNLFGPRYHASATKDATLVAGRHG